MCKKKQTRDRRKEPNSWSDDESVTLDDRVTKVKSIKIRPWQTRRKPVAVNISQENDMDDAASIPSRGNDKYREKRRSRRDMKDSPKIRRRLLSKSPLRQGKRCPLSSCGEDKKTGDKKCVSSTDESLSADLHKKKSKKAPKGRKILCGLKREKHKERRSKSQSFGEHVPGQKASLDGSKSSYPSNGYQKKVTDTSSPRVKVRQDQNLSPKLLRAFSSESMLWSEASWNRPSIQSTEKISDKNSEVQKASLDKGNSSSEHPGLKQMYSGKEKAVLTKSAPVTDELRVIYTTPDRLTHLQGQVDQTQDILRPIIVNRARGMIDRAMDELHRSINLSAATNQEFLKVGDSSGNRPRRLWMTELFSKKSTRKMKSSLPRLPSTQRLTSAVASARESAFSLIAPSRNISVRLMSDQVKSETELPIINDTENKNAVTTGVSSMAKVSQSEQKVTIKKITVKGDKDDHKKAGGGGNKNKLKYWWRFGQKGKDKDNQESDKKTKSDESRDQHESKPKNGCEESSEKRWSWKTLREVLRPTKSRSKTGTSPKSDTNTDPLPIPPNKADNGQLRKESDNTTAKKAKQYSTKKDTKEDIERRGKFSQTLAKARKGWKKFNDWLDE